jgi:hypothetical protein
LSFKTRIFLNKYEGDTIKDFCQKSLKVFPKFFWEWLVWIRLSKIANLKVYRKSFKKQTSQLTIQQINRKSLKHKSTKI